MINHLFRQIYVANIPTLIILMFVIFIAWSVIGALFYRRMRLIGGILAVLAVSAILYVTVFYRGRSEPGLELAPFSSFTRAIKQPELYRSMLMNVFLFLPLGMSLPFVLGGKTWQRILLTILIGCLLSVGVETIQYIFSNGLTETDDVICNTLGAAFGSCAYPLSLLWKGIISKKKGQE